MISEPKTKERRIRFRKSNKKMTRKRLDLTLDRITFKSPEVLAKFTTDTGKILPSLPDSVTFPEGGGDGGGVITTKKESLENSASKLAALRAQAEIKLQDAFDQQAFHDFILDQGLLPPEILKQAVMDEFVPSQLN